MTNSNAMPLALVFATDLPGFFGVFSGGVFSVHVTTSDDDDAASVALKLSRVYAARFLPMTPHGLGRILNRRMSNSGQGSFVLI